MFILGIVCKGTGILSMKYILHTLFCFSVIFFMLFSAGCTNAVTSSPETESTSGSTSEPADIQSAAYRIHNSTLEILSPGSLNDTVISKALAGGSVLTVSGPLIPENYELFSGRGITELDLSAVTGLSNGTIAVSPNRNGIQNREAVIPIDFYGDTQIKKNCIA